MNVLLSLLQKSTDYNQLLKAVEAKQAVAVSGLSQAPRSHVLAAAHEQSGRPLVAVCQDDMAAKRLASELGAFLGEEPPVLPSRELTLAGAIGVSRQWEQQRLRLLYALAQGRVPVLVASLDALLLRTLPRQTLFSASVTLRVGAEYSMPELIERLTRAGYSRASLVEGVGQFALRGGILDVYSPAQEKPLRAEFFGDELDTMGYFDPITQRRTENADEAILLPVAETEPHLHPQGVAGLCGDLRAIITRQQRRKTPNQALIETLQKDCEALENETLFASADRYMALIYPEFTTAASYLPQEAVVAFCDHGNLQRGEKDRAEEFGLLLDSFLTSGTQISGRTSLVPPARTAVFVTFPASARESTSQSVRQGLNSSTARASGSSSGRSRRLSAGISTVVAPAAAAAMVFSFSPPMASTSPVRVTSPVIATSWRTGMPERALTSAVTMAHPAEGPSFGTAPSGK